MLKLENINSIEDIKTYCEGLLNDMDFGLSSKEETLKFFNEFIIYLIKLGSNSFENTINRSYKSIVKRGKIKPETQNMEFILKMQEELDEIKLAQRNFEFGKDLQQVFNETMDLINACFCFLKHNQIDIKELFIKIIEKNEQRTD